ncbi:M48 family metallopeptidase [Rheinheimera maricola]|uniref:M48 family metallopeptidase n=1 Tax=Rheinheimera maricola TaxID=2793282 RepID=A0ABS7X6V4_9GAMM|nr:M48 family metallopeptidase [Rheinheimera maricola]MBZ9611269.1 M48 family metallopeptidase [Rheinheimera maricola]
MSSNFFAQQDLARRNTRILVTLFTLAVLLLLLLTNIVAVISLGFVDPAVLNGSWQWQSLPWNLVALVSVIVIAAVGLAVLFKWQQLKAGGKVVAESLGGQRLTADSDDPLQRRLLNVVEEMALAANTPVPPVYLLPEPSINAFAAGYSPADAVIGVTQGCLEQLNRDELQGVVAHEFSHILNGDMRMNIRLIAILNGILFLGHIGYYMLRGSSRSSTVRLGTSRSSSSKKDGGGILLLALGLVVIGYVGSFFGNLIKAAVSRQREFLADASAVQFTRNPRGIAGALKVIGSHNSRSKIANPNADENSHLFFGEAISRWASIFATHPPLSNRIKRLEPQWNGKFPTPRSTQTTSGEEHTSTTSQAKPTQAERLQQALPLILLHSSRQTEPAQALVCCLLLQQDDSCRAQQLRLIKELGSVALLQQVDQLCDSVATLNALQQVQLLQRVMPALKALTEGRFKQFEQLLHALFNSIASPGISPWLVSQFVEHSLAAQFDPTQISKKYSAKTLSQLGPAVSQLLALVSSAAGDEQQQQQAWQAAISTLAFNLNSTRPEVALQLLTQQLPLLLALAPLQKQQLWQAIERCVQADKLLQNNEQALLLALALLLEIPYQSNAANS